MRRHLLYLRYVMRHKFWVLVGCARLARLLPISEALSLIWRGLIHDTSKFRPSEWLPYAAFFYGDKPVHFPGDMKPSRTESTEFDRAWLFHLHRNRHHWQHWLLTMDDGTVEALDMPTQDYMEMLADWYGAGRAQGHNDTPGWYRANKHKITLSPRTRLLVEARLRFWKRDMGGKP